MAIRSLLYTTESTATLSDTSVLPFLPAAPPNVDVGSCETTIGATSQFGTVASLRTQLGVATTSNPQFNSLGVGVAASGTQGRLDTSNGTVTGVLLPDPGTFATNALAFGTTSAHDVVIVAGNNARMQVSAAGAYIRPVTNNATSLGDATHTLTYVWVTGETRVATRFDQTTNTTLANVTGLSATVAAGSTYRFRAQLYTSSNVAGGVQFAVSGTATATAISYDAIVYDAGAIKVQSRATTLGTAVGAVTAVTAAYAFIEGTITVNAGGTLTVQFAQNASNAAASSVLVGSTFTVQPVA